MWLKNKCINANVILAYAVTEWQKGTLLCMTHRWQYLVGNIIFGSLDNKAAAIGGDSMMRNKGTAKTCGMQKRWISAGAELSKSVWGATRAWMAACKYLMQGSVVDHGRSKPEIGQMKCFLQFQGKKWSVKRVHLPTEKDRSPVVCLVKGVYATSPLRSKGEPEHHIMHPHTPWQWGVWGSHCRGRGHVL